MGISIGIDIGGTFTDVVALETTTGELTIAKVPSTPPHFEEGFFNGLEKILSMTGVPTRCIERLIHGTTIATNSILEAKGARIGILTTAGFEDILIIGRLYRSNLYSLFLDAETPTFLCERRCTIGIKERMDPRGNVVIPLDEAGVIEAVDYLVKQHEVQAIAVCYLFSFANPIHEQRTAQIIRERYPNVRVSLSSFVNPGFREYERMVITAFDAYVGPQLEEYIRKLEDGLRRGGINVVLQVMQSRGGITSAAMCMEKPVVTLLSGPAGGVAGGAFIGYLCGRENLITLDMGGTSNDVTLIRHGKPYLSIEGKIGKYPLRQAMVEINTIGAGGGSIAWVDAAGGLKVGPQSAGAVPGPACYGRGGREPTVTDASVVLGYLNPECFAGGELVLKPQLARKAIQKSVSTQTSMEVTKAAAAIHKIINSKMADQLRLVSVYKGYHPRDFSLVSFGGAGPIAAGRLMQQLGIKEVICPISPGVLSAFGLLVAEIQHEEVASYAARADEVNPKKITKVYTRLREVCEQKRAGVGISSTELHVYYSAEMRYAGQSYELEVPLPEGRGEITKSMIQDIVKRFHSVHHSIYQHSLLDSPVEFVAFRMVYSQSPQPTPKLRELNGTPCAEIAPKSRRQAYFDEYQGFVDTLVYDRTTLTRGQKLMGPAIVEQADTTTVIYPNQVAEVDKWGNLVVRAAQGK